MSAVVPAAGRGSRLGFDGPKALATIAGQPLIDFVLDALVTEAVEIVIVASPSGRDALAEHVRRRYSYREVVVVVQEQPNGSAEAVRIGLQAASSPLCLVAWCDQVGLLQSTVADVARRLHEDPQRGVLPITEVANPYVWMEYDPAGYLQQVGRARDGDQRPAVGLSDLGLFGLPREIPLGASHCADLTRELDFVYELPCLSQAGLLDSFVVEELNQTLAVNTGHDLIRAAEIIGVLA
jgi:bifunctional UDP-N-acetylglucosamine pyrophosphorylase/glucosamine-1-phosphate N-acetyltransferase